MKASRLIMFILVFHTSAYAGKTPAGSGGAMAEAPGGLAAGRVIDSVICRSDPSQSYALYIPEKGNKEAMPILYFFDPHGNGSLPLNKYKALADAYGFILAGSNNSKNGNDWPVTDNIWLHVAEDTKSRLKINAGRIYTVGFSGGAKVASYLALNHPEVKGVIAGGAGLPDGVAAGDFNFSFTAIAGEGDMNMTELVAISRELDHTRTRHRILFFDGKHEWAPAGTMNLAFTGLQLDAMRLSLLPRDEAFINRYIENSKKRLHDYYQFVQLIRVDRECRFSVSLLEGLTAESRWFQGKADELAATPLFKQQQQARESLLVREQNTKAEYEQHFQQDNMPYWTKTIGDLQAKANGRSSEGDMYQRLLAYLSLAFYSISNHFINSNGNAEAAHFVTLYKLADPGNSEAWYFSAILNARNGEARAAQDDLLKAVGFGFRDERRMKQQPEFQASRLNFSAIEASMRAPGKDK